MEHYGNKLIFPSSLLWKAPYYLYIFDLDETLITRINGKDPRHPCDHTNNWQFYPGVIDYLWYLINKGVYLVIITNQLNINAEKIEQISSIWNTLNQYPLILCSLQHDEYRKPQTGFMNYLKTIMTEEPKYISYCGDAVGSDDPFPPYRWSSVDKDFAVNIGAVFTRPTDIFISNFMTYVPTQNLVIMVGNQGSGKTTTAKRLESIGYVRFSQDEAGKLDAVKRINNIRNHLVHGYKVVVDATHAKSSSRQKWVDLATSINVSSIILWHIRDGRYFNEFREHKVPPVAYFNYTKNFEYPQETEMIIIH